MKIKSILVLILILSFIITGFSQSQGKDDLIKVHFVGNSYTYYQNLPQVVATMAQGRRINIRTSKTVLGGAELREHWNSGSEDKPNWNLDTKSILKNGNFDIVILQDRSLMPIEFPDSTLKYVELFSNFVKDTGAKPYLYLTWARERIPQIQDDLNKIFKTAAKRNSIQIVPVGDAWKLARELRPAINLFAEDGTHPSHLGAYLSACVFFAKLTGESPVGLRRKLNMKDEFGESIVLMNLNREDAIFLQTVAQTVVEEWEMHE